ncbi:MAG: Si-specific NAD(P)(+) transhydrogenase [Anaerolineales bacterium]|nr:Si-specific NAD(P)(+) transhydrogenase [Anaerolineales bacterium]
MADYDLVVIGSGPAGEKGAVQAAYFGKRVALVERAPRLGGSALNTGTIPSKTLRETALYFSGLRQRGLYGIDYSLKEGLTVHDFMHREQVVVSQERQIIEQNLARHKVEIVWGSGSLVNPHTVRVQTPSGETRNLNTDFILIATGSSPFHPPDVPFDQELIYDSDSILNMKFIPKCMAVVGGGVIGCEYASLFTALGVQVTLVESRDRLLPVVDDEIAAHLETQLSQMGLRFIFKERVTKTEIREGHVHLQLKSGTELDCDIAMFAAGRQSNVEGLDLEALGVILGERGLIRVNEHYQTNIPNIYAAGDVIGFPALASTSMEQARVAMVHAFNLHYKERVSPVLPYAIYTIPEISMVGLSEDECIAKQIPYLVGRAYYANNPRGQIIGEVHGMVKLIFSPGDKKLLGVHHIGEMSAELVHIGAHALASGQTIDAFIMAVYNYPTLSDSYKYAAYDGLGQWDQWQGSLAAAEKAD